MPQSSAKPHAKKLRTGRFSQPGQIYVITTITRDRIPMFNDFQAARTVIQVMQGHEHAEFAETIRALKSITSRRIGRSIFQKGYYDHAVRKEEDIKGLARYIITNPLRAGLVKSINDYPHWDAVWL